MYSVTFMRQVVRSNVYFCLLLTSFSRIQKTCLFPIFLSKDRPRMSCRSIDLRSFEIYLKSEELHLLIFIRYFLLYAVFKVRFDWLFDQPFKIKKLLVLNHWSSQLLNSTSLLNWVSSSTQRRRYPSRSIPEKPVSIYKTLNLPAPLRPVRASLSIRSQHEAV